MAFNTSRLDDLSIRTLCRMERMERMEQFSPHFGLNMNTSDSRETFQDLLPTKEWEAKAENVCEAKAQNVCNKLEKNSKIILSNY